MKSRPQRLESALGILRIPSNIKQEKGKKAIPRLKPETEPCSTYDSFRGFVSRPAYKDRHISRMRSLHVPPYRQTEI